MKLSQKKAYLLAIRDRYATADRKTKAIMLQEFCSVCNYNRKYAIQLLNKSNVHKTSRPGPAPKYQDDKLIEALKLIWFTADQPCGKRLKPILKRWLKHYEDYHGPLEEDIKNKLLSISSATIDRILKPTRVKSKVKGLSGTKPGTLLKNKIEIKTHNWDVTKPGFIEADTVALCGNSLVGNFVWCVVLTDICSTWTEIRATWNKGAAGVLEQIKNIEEVLIFPMIGFDSDNGTEFLNSHLLRYLEQRDLPVKFTRSRPYKKNDNAHVEQKNWTHVRHLFGYDRFDNFKLVDMMNDLLANEWSLYQNHFIPSMKLISKTKVNSKYKRKYDEPKTPYERLMASSDISKTLKIKLAVQHNKLNPFILREQIERKLTNIFSLVSIKSGTKKRI